MIHNSDEFIRRTLSFPAIKPTDTVSQTTLLDSLLFLSSQIFSFKSLLITSNKRNAKSAINRIEVLKIFLEELRDSDGFSIPKPAILSLLDIHVALQKLVFLFQDCTRQDARVWMLVNSKRVAGHFRAVIGSMSIALNGVVLNSTVEDEEVRDYAEYIIKQGKKILGRFEAEFDDISAKNLIALMLNQLERKVIPDPNNLKRVMNYLGVQNWSDCNNQVKFLEDESGSNPEAGRIMGLMVYCRCVLFHGSDPNDGIINNHSGSVIKTRKRYSGFMNPDDFNCPISLEIMGDPVTIPSGQTYDRNSILKWFKSGNPVCPKTGQKLDSLNLVPNLALKQVIKFYCWENGISLPLSKLEGKEKNIIINTGKCTVNLATENAMKMAADFLSIKLAMGTVTEKSKSAYEIRVLTKRNEFNRACFVESGAILYLLNLLLCKDSTAQENSAAALLNLSKDSQGKAAIADNGGLALIVRVVKTGFKIETRQYAAAILFYLSSVENCRRLIGENPDAIPSLVELIRAGGDRGKKSGLVSIFALLFVPNNHCLVLEAGLVPLLVTLLGTMESEDIIADSLAVLSALAERPDGSKAVLHAKGLNAIIAILCSSSYDSSRLRSEHCASLLLSLCINSGGQVIDVLAKNASLTTILYSLLTEGTSRASKKAGSLIRLLHEYSERRSSYSMPRALPHENFIHVW